MATNKCPRQPQEARLLRAVRHRRGLCAVSLKNYPFRPARWPVQRTTNPKELLYEPHTHSTCRDRPWALTSAVRRRAGYRRHALSSTTPRTSVPIRAKLKYTTLIQVPPTEKIMEAGRAGDKDFWVVDVVGNFCFVHPAKAGISSNLNLITDKGKHLLVSPCRMSPARRGT